MSENTSEILNFLTEGGEPIVHDCASISMSWMDDVQSHSSSRQQPIAPAAADASSTAVATLPSTQQQENPTIDLTTPEGRARMNEIRDALKNASNYFRLCETKNYKLMMSTTSDNQAPAEVITALLNGIKAGSTRAVRSEFSKIMSYNWYIPFAIETETVFNSKKVCLMASFLSFKKIAIRHISPELRNTDFAVLAIRPNEYLTWAVFPEPNQQLSPAVTAVALYALLGSTDVKRINRDCRRNNVPIRLLN